MQSPRVGSGALAMHDRGRKLLRSLLSLSTTAARPWLVDRPQAAATWRGLSPQRSSTETANNIGPTRPCALSWMRDMTLTTSRVSDASQTAAACSGTRPGLAVAAELDGGLVAIR